MYYLVTRRRDTRRHLEVVGVGGGGVGAAQRHHHPAHHPHRPQRRHVLRAARAQHRHARPRPQLLQLPQLGRQLRAGAVQLRVGVPAAAVLHRHLVPELQRAAVHGGGRGGVAPLGTCHTGHAGDTCHTGHACRTCPDPGTLCQTGQRPGGQPGHGAGGGGRSLLSAALCRGSRCVGGPVRCSQCPRHSSHNS